MTSEANDIKIDKSKLAEITRAIPPEDFVDSQFDQGTETATTDVLVLLSTPRCGSTLLADLIRRAGLCLPHEYFQPYEYMPVLADRWGCIENAVLNKKNYVDRLLSFRTYPSGWLGINLHGLHLQSFEEFSGVWPSLREHYIHIKRRDIITQAVSYEIAKQTGKWSSHFSGKSDSKYNYKAVKKTMQIIQDQDLAITEYVRSNDLSCMTVFYEDLIADPGIVLRKILPDGYSEISPYASDLKLQSNETNQEWARRFYAESAKRQ